jgi:NAD(P)-dependent dehydrogenase (short-subunit alcohol dehydrogenase family)
LATNLYRAKPADGIAWITGASTGIGRSLALELAKDGYTVALTARSPDKLALVHSEIIATGGKAVIAPGDVTDEKAMAALIEIVEAKGPIALAVFNAGNYWENSGKKLEMRTFRDTYEINVFGVLNGLIPVVEKFKQRKQGHVVIVSSVSGYTGLPKASAYASSKAAMINMAECLYFDFVPMNIGLQLVTPGFIDTPLTEKNDFAMPALMPVDKAARRMADGFKTQTFEITFPRRFTWFLKLLAKLPYRLYFRAIEYTTGSKK